MDYAEIKEVLSRPINRAETLSLLREISRHVNNAATHNQGRDLVIRALAISDQFKESERTVLMALVRNVGLFPYLADTISTADLSDQIAFELHRPDSADTSIVFHSLQARIYHQLMLGSNVVLSASTSSGKSLVVDEVIASEKYKKIAIVVPTLALIDETRRRILQRFGERCAVITHPSQEAKAGRINVYVLTQERVNHRSDLEDVEFFVIDEFYKMDLSSEREPDRAVDLNLAFHKLAKTGAQFYLLGPNIQAVMGLDAYEHHFIPSEFSTVAVDVVALNLPTRGTEREDGLIALCEKINEPTIVYCQSPASASIVAKALVDRLNLPFVEDVEGAASWIAEKYDPDWIVCNALRRGVGIHHGGVPRALQQYFIRLFNTRKIKFLVCTSTIIEGVNTVAKNVIVYDRRKSRDVLEHFTYKNIEGRAGRMNQYFVGKVFVLEELPVDQSFSVEMPIGSQSGKTPMSLLLSLPDEDLEEVSKERVSSLFEGSTLSPATLRANRYVPWDTQENLAAEIRGRVRELGPLLSWSRVPSGEQLAVVCELIFTYLSTHALRENDIHSGSQLALHLNELRIGQNLTAYVKGRVATRHPNVTPSQAVEGALRIVRNIICQRFPRDLMVINAIQNDVLPKLGMRPGNYALFAEQAENLFMPSALFALDEYGIPIQTVKALERYLMPSASLDEVLQKLKTISLDNSQISSFEREIVEEVRSILFPAVRRSRS
ncbi:DEAD/DEAH box helicase [Tardiphaga sp. 813_E8_N1_3]|uniref:DEAD/DEAH box helicase n=1 Tax=Tardiphaga sp. 813_E8_N1_3 TaxID=3240760 RepID=UPI003F222943